MLVQIFNSQIWQIGYVGHVAQLAQLADLFTTDNWLFLKLVMAINGDLFLCLTFLNYPKNQKFHMQKFRNSGPDKLIHMGWENVFLGSADFFSKIGDSFRFHAVRRYAGRTCSGWCRIWCRILDTFIRITLTRMKHKSWQNVCYSYKINWPSR